MQKMFFSFLLFCAAVFPLSAQSITLDSCQIKARNNYPLIKRFSLIEQSHEYNLSNANRAYLPQLSLLARATYQSDVTKIPIPEPFSQLMDIPELKKDQYNAALELTQVIWDGGNISSHKKMADASSEVEKQQAEVDLYALRQRVNQLFFGILLLNEQLKQNDLFNKELQRNYDMISSYMQNGLANQADLDAVKIEQLNNNQNKIKIIESRKAYIEMLGYLIGEPLNENTSFEKPSGEVEISKNIQRPELQLFSAQTSLFEAQNKLITANNMPTLGLFVQGGYGRPALNMLSPDFDFYYIGGVRLQWNLSNFYTQSNNRKKIKVNQNLVETQKETFLFNTNLQVSQESREIDKIKGLMAYDDEIIALRKNVKISAEAKVANGTLSVIEFLREVNAENMAKQSKILHEIELLNAIYELKNTVNN